MFSSSFGFALRALSDSYSRDHGTAVMVCLSSGESGLFQKTYNSSPRTAEEGLFFRRLTGLTATRSVLDSQLRVW